MNQTSGRRNDSFTVHDNNGAARASHESKKYAESSTRNVRSDDVEMFVEGVGRAVVDTTVQHHATHAIHLSYCTSYCDLQRMYYQDRLNLENQLDQLFNNRCEAIARRYSWLQKALRNTGRKNFKTAMRRNRDFHLKSTDVQREILLEMRYIKSI